MLSKEQIDSGSVDNYQKLTLEVIEKTLRGMLSEQELSPAQYIGDGLYELPGCIIANEEGYKEYLKELKERTKI